MRIQICWCKINLNAFAYCFIHLISTLVKVAILDELNKLCVGRKNKKLPLLLCSKTL